MSGFGGLEFALNPKFKLSGPGSGCCTGLPHAEVFGGFSRAGAFWGLGFRVQL